MQATMIISRCSGCGKSYQVDLCDVETRFGSFFCGQCNTHTTIENPNFKALVSVDDRPNPGAGLSSDSTADADVEDLFEELDEFSAENKADADFPMSKYLKASGLSIRARITLIIVLLVLGALTTVGLIASFESKSALSEQAEGHLSMVAQQKAVEYGLIFQHVGHEVEGVADYAMGIYSQNTPPEDLGLRPHLLMPWNGSGYGDPVADAGLEDETLALQQVVRMLKSVVAKNPYVILGYLGTETNIMALEDLAAVASIGETEGYINTKRPWYIKAKAERKTVWTAPYVDANSKELTVTCATPVTGRGGKIVGVVGYDVLLSTIQKDILALDIGYNSYAMLVDQAGKVLVRPGIDVKDTRWDESYEREDLTKTDNAAFKGIIANMMAGKNGVELFESNGRGRYAAYAPLKAIGASLAIIASQPSVIQPAKQMQTDIMIVWVVVLVMAILIGVMISNGITRPINQLTHMADQISQGMVDLDVLPENRTDEIGSLTRSFNRLVISLKMALTR